MARRCSHFSLTSIKRFQIVVSDEHTFFILHRRDLCSSVRKGIRRDDFDTCRSICQGVVRFSRLTATSNPQRDVAGPDDNQWYRCITQLSTFRRQGRAHISKPRSSNRMSMVQNSEPSVYSSHDLPLLLGVVSRSWSPQIICSSKSAEGNDEN